ncbi:MAG: DUF1624 domain-containing protein [Clostridiaceae bacterium]|nr:DUF1624 domain-containing protein [Clostridiaceae bacterium]
MLNETVLNETMLNEKMVNNANNTGLEDKLLPDLKGIENDIERVIEKDAERGIEKPKVHNAKGKNAKVKDGKGNRRIWELDFLRGIALILMVYFHVVFDMKDIFGYNVDYSKGFNKFTGSAAGILFIVISGISCALSRNNFKRALRILGIAIGITVATHLYDAGLGIKFGILHFLGLSILLYHLLAKMNVYVLAAVGTVILLAGRFISSINIDHDYFFILGITSSKFISADYYPLIPWLGLFIYGIIIGKTFYRKKESIFGSPPGSVIGSMVRIIIWLGRNTLVIYVIHQPVILLVITLVKRVFG